jgi:hypothetical protein
MGQRNVRVVIGEGDPDRHGFLRTTLEDDGFDVVGEATTTSPLARLLIDERPDVVVLDAAIGVSAVQLAAEVVPSAKIVVVWPAAVMPIAGAIRVDPSEVASSLGPTVALAAGIGGLSIERPEWVERVRKDPATLRELLAARGGVPVRPSVTELQRPGHRLHPGARTSRRGARPTTHASDPQRRAVVTPLPLLGAGAGAAAATSRSNVESWNRRLGVIALGGAVAASALMIALAFGNRAPSFTAAEPFLPPIVQPTDVVQPPVIGIDGDGGQDAGQGGTDGQDVPGGPGTGIRGDLTGSGTPSGDGGGGTGSGTGGDQGTGDGGTGGSDRPSGDGGGGTSPRSNAHLPGTHGGGGGDGGGTNGEPSADAPGNSGAHNPHGGPPGMSHRPDHAGHGVHTGGSSGSHGRSGAHANVHAHKQ